MSRKWLIFIGVILVVIGIYYWQTQSITTANIDKIFSTFKFTETEIETKAVATGTLSGKVSIGPNFPVEREGVPCDPSPEAYAAREFLVLDKNQHQVASFHGGTDGSFSLSLPAGIYTVVSAKSGMGYMSKDLPATVTVSAGKITTLNIDVDTGIR